MARNRRARLPRNPCNKLIAFIILLLCGGGVAALLPGRVISVADGDTIIVLTSSGARQKIRLYGIDCPEKRQAWGNRAAQITGCLCAGRTVEIQGTDTDRYGRTVAIVILPTGRTLQEELLAEGMAWVWPKYCKLSFCEAWLELEAQTRESKVGLWQGEEPVPPWEWRNHREAP